MNKKVYRHISYLELGNYGKVACNALLYYDSDELMILNTPTK